MIKIRLSSPEFFTEFVNICSAYDCDVNVYDENTIIDAKSVIGVFNITVDKVIKVQAITSDESVISSFIKDMRKFEV